jgi:hypothetical protein
MSPTEVRIVKVFASPRIASAVLNAVLACLVPASALAAEIGTAIERLDPAMAVKDPAGEYLWYDAKGLTVEGKGWTDTEAFYDRLPARAKSVVPAAVWSLGKRSAGLCVRFETNARKISARWTVVDDNLSMPHMPATGVSGLDVYVNDNGTWRWIGSGRPTGRSTQAVLASGIPEGTHEYMVYLPLYNLTESLAIGVPPDAGLSTANPRPGGRNKPVVFYGTSITQGGCASRPGMAHTAILGRRLDCPVINLGFSGNGKMDPEVAALLAELEAVAYVIDCVPNMSPEMITKRTIPLVETLRKARPDTPIVLVEGIHYQSGAFLTDVRSGNERTNMALRAEYDRLVHKGVTGLVYATGESLLGGDGEATVDGIHPTDLGFLRIADALEPALRQVMGR